MGIKNRILDSSLTIQMMFKHVFEDLLIAIKESCLEVYGDRLVSLCVFGSVAAETMRPDSDIDLLVICDPLPYGRIARIREFETVDGLCEKSLKMAKGDGIVTTFSPLIKTPYEVCQGSPLFLDMTDTVKILFDREGFLKDYLNVLREKLKGMGARRINFCGGYYWILKPDLNPGEEITL